MKQISLLMLWMDRTQFKLKIADEKNLQYHNELTTKLARTGSEYEKNQECSTGEICWKYFCISALVFIL